MPSLEIRTNGGVVRVVMPYDGNDSVAVVLAMKDHGIWSFRCTETELPEVQRFIDEYEKPCRAEVLEFAKNMELKLRANDSKSHWSECSKEYLSVRLTREVIELLAALGLGVPEIRQIVDEKILILDEHDYQSDPRFETVDVANFAMMIHDNLTHNRF